MDGLDFDRRLDVGCRGVVASFLPEDAPVDLAVMPLAFASAPSLALLLSRLESFLCLSSEVSPKDNFSTPLRRLA